MNDKFFDLKKEKQDRMINAALKIFGQLGYRFASTDDIVREAGISKGLLFHYFGSKLGLYSFIYDYSVRYMSMELKASVNPKETDFFAIYKQMEIGKLQVLKNYPCMQLFLDKCNEETVSEALLAIEEKRLEFQQFCNEIDAQANLSIFPTPEDGEKIRYMLKCAIRCTMEKHFMEHSFHAEMLYDENIAYIALLKNILLP